MARPLTANEAIKGPLWLQCLDLTGGNVPLGPTQCTTKNQPQMRHRARLGFSTSSDAHEMEGQNWQRPWPGWGIWGLGKWLDIMSVSSSRRCSLVLKYTFWIVSPDVTMKGAGPVHNTRLSPGSYVWVNMHNFYISPFYLPLVLFHFSYSSKNTQQKLTPSTDTVWVSLYCVLCALRSHFVLAHHAIPTHASYLVL